MRFPIKQTMTVFNYMRKQKKAGVERFPLVLMLEPLHACNLTCSGCGRIREYKDYMSEMVTFEDCLKVIDECGAPVVSICGGEPLLYPRIGELVDETVARGHVVYLCTNGQTLEKSLDKFTPSKLFNFNIHIDGMAKTHDMVVEKEGAFDKAIAGIVAAKKAGFSVCTNTTVYQQTDVQEVITLIGYLKDLGVDGFLMSPGFDYGDVEDQTVFLTRETIREKFKALREIGRDSIVWSTPLFLDYLAGDRDYPCTPWGNVTYNVCGWKAPCYLITDEHYKSYDEFMNKVDWSKYGPGNDPRCENCMAHCGVEPTIALSASSNIKDALTMAKWTLF